MITLRTMVVGETGIVSGSDRDDGERFGVTDGVTILEAFCQAQLIALPRGGRGVKAAVDLLAALPDACRLGWRDMTVSAPQLFRMLEDAGLITGCPTASDIPASLRLVESVCGLVTQRSPRRWTVWFASACDPDHALGASIRGAVTPAMINRGPSAPPTESPRRTTSLREERDQLASELDSLRAESGALQVTNTRAHADLESAVSQAADVETELLSIKRERDRLKRSLATTTEERDSLRRELERVRSTALKIQADRDELRQKQETSVQTKEALEVELASARRQAQKANATRDQERERERREAAQLRAAKEKLDRERSGLQAEISGLKQKGELQADRIRSLHNDIYLARKDATVLRRALDGVRETFEIEPFEPEEPHEFLLAIDQVLQDAEERTKHVAAVCARVLDRRTVEWLLHGTVLRVLRDGEIPLATIDKYFRDPPKKVFDECIRGLEKMRSSLAAEGVVLPPTTLTRSDLRE